MKKLVCGLTLCLSVGNIFAGSTKDIYKKNWIDFNKNGVKDVYEDPAAPIEALSLIHVSEPTRPY